MGREGPELSTCPLVSSSGHASRSLLTSRRSTGDGCDRVDLLLRPSRQELALLEYGAADRVARARRRIQRCEQRVQLRRVRPGSAVGARAARLASRRDLPKRGVDAALVRNSARPADRRVRFSRSDDDVAHPRAAPWSNSSLHVQGVTRRQLSDRLPRPRA